MKITVKQLKQIIKEQVEEMAHNDSEGEEQENLTGTFSLTIELGNASMLDKYDLAKALAGVERYIRSATFGFRGHGGFSTIRDDNGNRVGQWNIED